MKYYPTITVALSAFNEQESIGRILSVLTQQKLKHAKLDQILVLSDGSTDNTNRIVKSFNHRKVKLIAFKTRKGKNARLNDIFKRSTSDILVILDADIYPDGEFFLEKLTRKLTKDHLIGIVGGDTISYGGKNFVQKCISLSHDLKRCIYKSINSGNNVYLCHGRVRAFGKKFYSTLRMPDDCPEDAYSYFDCIARGFQFRFASNARVFFLSPATIDDHIKQSSRFYRGKSALSKYFSREVLDKEYHLPKFRLILPLFESIIFNPLYTVSYVLLNMYIRLFKLKHYIHQSRWEIALSSKGDIPR